MIDRGDPVRGQPAPERQSTMDSPLRQRSLTYAAILLVSFAIGIGAVYVTHGVPDNRAEQGGTSGEVYKSDREASASPTHRREPLARGDMAAFVMNRAPQPLPEISFQDGAGKLLSLTRWKGKVVLLNIWATWCAPCRKEMPDLDRLQAALGSDRFEVVALAVDRAGVEGAKAFLDNIGAKRLAVYADPGARAGSALRIAGMPTTLLLDPQGMEIGRLTGPAKWDGADARALIVQLIERLHASR